MSKEVAALDAQMWNMARCIDFAREVAAAIHAKQAKETQ